MKENDINFELPKISLHKIKELYDITPLEESLILGILFDPKDGVGVLRATRPKQSGELSWLWRYVIMFASPEEKFHAVTPSMAKYLSEFTNPAITESALSQLADKIINSIPNSELPGLVSWRESLGV